MALTMAQITNGQSYIQLSGVVTDKNHSPIQNAHISVQGTKIGTITNFQGQFVLKVSMTTCESNLLISHVGYQTANFPAGCENQHDIKVVLIEQVIHLDEVRIYALSAEHIVLNAITNLKKNYQLDSVQYTIFSRITEMADSSPILLKEFVFNLYHDADTKPQFYIIKVRSKGFTKLGSQRLKEDRLIDIHATESHIMLRYVPVFLKKNKMKRYIYELIEERFIENEPYYVISVTSQKKNYMDKGEIWINKENYGIFYLEEHYIDEHWKDESKLNTVYKSYYLQDRNKWYFKYGVKDYAWKLNEENILIEIERITVATDITQSRTFEKSDEMGLMTQMLKDFTGNFNDDFWGSYNYIPLPDLIQRNITDSNSR